MSKIYTYAKFQIPPEALDEFKALAGKCLERVKQNEPGTLFYEWFFNADETQCVALDCYRDLDALLQHVENNREDMKRIISLAPRHLEIFGENPSARIGGGRSTAGDDSYFGPLFLGTF